jgi:hypothetical protein
LASFILATRAEVEGLVRREEEEGEEQIVTHLVVTHLVDYQYHPEGCLLWSIRKTWMEATPNTKHMGSH